MRRGASVDSLLLILLLITISSCSHATPHHAPAPRFNKRQSAAAVNQPPSSASKTAVPASATHTASASKAAAPIVDLGYARYQGSYDPQYDLNVYKGIRYAAPPIGKLRWQAPQPPPTNTSAGTIQATETPPLCPQSGGGSLPKVYGFNSAPGDEDCLFLNVYAPKGAKDLPVFVWIHGGGYALFGASLYDPSALIAANRPSNNPFIAVMIQYRLGAFGFLSSEEVKERGNVNAGLLDQRFALQWVQKNIGKFGGDKSRVTLGGESAGAGAVLLQSIAEGGREKGLFDNIIAASVYVAKQYNYNDPVPEQKYKAFAKAAGCGKPSSGSRSTFDCLVNAESATLQNASGTVSEAGDFGTFAFLPVTDGDFIPGPPSKQLKAKAVSGKRLLVGNNANEGSPLTPPTVLTANDFLKYVHTTFPSLRSSDLTRLFSLYQFSRTSDGGTNANAPLFDTLGDTGPTAINQSGIATGTKQRTLNLNAESTYVCPGYWFAEAFSSLSGGMGKRDSEQLGGGGERVAYKYQYSVPPAFHGADLAAYWSINPNPPTSPPPFTNAFQKIWGSFIATGTPIIPSDNGAYGLTTSAAPAGSKGGWPTWNPKSPKQVDLNVTGGSVKRVPVTDDFSYVLLSGNNIRNKFRVVDAASWEGGRGERCNYWWDVASRIPQ